MVIPVVGALCRAAVSVASFLNGTPFAYALPRAAQNAKERFRSSTRIGIDSQALNPKS